jgi:hypothetical protein
MKRDHLTTCYFLMLLATACKNKNEKMYALTNHPAPTIKDWIMKIICSDWVTGRPISPAKMLLTLLLVKQVLLADQFECL